MPDTASEKYYNFSKYACELNEEEDGVSPTDSRLRPDQRFMELGQWDDANTEKVRLEEKQRSVPKIIPMWKGHSEEKNNPGKGLQIMLL